MMSSSSRPKNFRRKSSANNDDADDPSTTSIKLVSSSSSSSKPNKPKPSDSAPPKRLSFADDVDDDDDNGGGINGNRSRPTSGSMRRHATPPSSVHKLSSSRDRSKAAAAPSLPPPPPIPSNVQPQTGEYTKERLLELQKNTRHIGSMPRPQPHPSETTPAVAEPFIVLKGTLKPQTTQDDGGKVVVSKLPDEADDDDDENSAVMFDQATIQAIRAKRQQRQQPRRPAPDYISLDDSMPSSRPTVGGSSDEEDNDFGQRIALFETKADLRMQKKGVLESMERINSLDGGFSRVEIGMDDGDDEDEDRKWEEAQVKKGLGSVPKVSSNIPTIPTGARQQNAFLTGVSKQNSVSPTPVEANSFGASRSAEVMSIPQQAEVATRALQDSINKLRESHNITLNSLVKTDTNIAESLSEITSLEKALKDADEKYVFMQEIRDFVSVTCEFLNDKAFYIEELEEQMQKLHEKRALAVFERRAEDTADETNEVDVAVNAAMAVLSKGSGSAYESAAVAAAQAAIAASREGANLPAELDEFGRDTNLKKRMDLKRRSEARKRRKALAESKRLASVGRDNLSEQVEGELSTDESDGENTAYASSRNELLQTAQEIFSDASNEYSNLKIVKERFENWKNLYPSSYRNAYVSLSVPSIFSPYVRLELLKWDPLYEVTEFFDMEWHKLLFDYGLQGRDQEFEPDDADANLIPELVEKVALPILHHEIEHCWDILSTQRTKNAILAADMVINYVPSSSKALHELLAAVHNRLKEAVNSLTVPIWNTNLTNTVPGAAQVAAYRFGMSVRLLRNICTWKNIMSLPVLEKLALEELMRGKILPHIRSVMSNIHDAIAKTERVVSALSGAWSGTGVTSDPSPKLKPLVDFVANLTNKLEKRQSSGVSEEETRALARRLKNILVALNEYDKARSLLKTFNLKEAL